MAPGEAGEASRRESDKGPKWCSRDGASVSLHVWKLLFLQFLHAVACCALPLPLLLLLQVAIAVATASTFAYMQ